MIVRRLFIYNHNGIIYVGNVWFRELGYTRVVGCVSVESIAVGGIQQREPDKLTWASLALESSSSFEEFVWVSF